MEPIQPQFPWQNSWYGDASPDVKLICAILMQAWEDANRSQQCLRKIEAQEWFFSQTFIYFCQLIKLSPIPIQDYVIKLWRTK